MSHTASARQMVGVVGLRSGEAGGIALTFRSCEVCCNFGYSGYSYDCIMGAKLCQARPTGVRNLGSVVLKQDFPRPVANRIAACALESAHESLRETRQLMQEI